MPFSKRHQLFNQVEIKIIRLNQSFHWPPYLSAFLPDVQQKILSFHYETDQKRAFTSQLLQRFYLAVHCGIHPKNILLSTTAYGKPYLANPECQHISFNISHSGNFVVLAICENKDYHIGVDIEQINHNLEDIHEISKMVFSLPEQRLINNTPETFFKLWTKKEALLKACGNGFATDFYQQTALSATDVESQPNYLILTTQIDDYFLSICLRPKFEDSVAS